MQEPVRTTVSRLADYALRASKVRLVQFFVIGGLIFLVTPRPSSNRDIAITSAQIRALTNAEARRKGPASKSEALEAEVKERALEDELLYREGVRLGFDKNDAIVRQRVIQKVLFLAEELAGAGQPPTDAELRAYFESTRSQWRRPESFHFRHVLTRSPAAASEAKSRMEADPNLDSSTLGEPSPVPSDVTFTRDQASGSLGAEFASALGTLNVGTWSAPVHSAYGWHTVKILEHTQDAPATFDDVKGSLVGVYVVKRRQDAIAAYLQKSMANYRMTMDGKPITELHPSGRVALRTEGSAED